MRGAGAFLIAAMAFILAAGPAAAAGITPEIADYVPAAPVIYLEAESLKALADSVERLEAAEAFGKSAAPERYSKSKLSLKLADRAETLSEFLGEEVTLNKLLDLGTGRMGLALYDIGELEFLIIARKRPGTTRVARFVSSHQGFDKRRLADRDYYIKQDESGMAFAFTETEDLLVLSNSIGLIEDVLKCMQDPAGPDSIYADERFRDLLAEQKLHPEVEGGLFMYLNQEAIAGTTYFKVYWVFGNQKALSGIRAAGIWLEKRAGGGLAEHRLLLWDPEVKFDLERTLDMGDLGEKYMVHLSAYSAEGRPFNPKMLDGFIGTDFEHDKTGALDAGQLRVAAEVVLPRTSKETGVLSTARMAVLLQHEQGANARLTAQSMAHSIEEQILSKLIIAPREFGFEDRGNGIKALSIAPGREVYIAEIQGGAVLISNDADLIREGMESIKVADVSGPMVIDYGSVPARLLAPDFRSGMDTLGSGSGWSDMSAKRFFSGIGGGYLDALERFEQVSYQVIHFGRFDYEVVTFAP